MHFKLAYIKLTLFYVLIVMIISVSFSVLLFRISTDELGRGLNKQVVALCNHPASLLGQVPPHECEDMRSVQLLESSSRLKVNLIDFNILILVISSLLSYLMAKKTLEPIEKSMEAQKRFTADASHELRTPLTAMRTEIEVALRDKRGTLSDSHKLLRSNLEEINKLETLSSALLRLAKHQEETKQEFKEIVLGDIVSAAYERVESLALRRKIVFDNHFEKATVMGDKDSLIELFMVLIDNAIKYSPVGSKVSITVSSTDKHPTVAIQDRGAGIEAKDLPHIFDRFYRVDDSRNKQKTDGYGLGLAIAKSIVDLHGATISAKSSHRGSEFTVKF